MPFDIIGNTLKVGDKVCMRSTDMFVGVIEEIEDAKVLAPAGQRTMGVNGKIVIKVTVQRGFLPENPIVDCIVVKEPKTN